MNDDEPLIAEARDVRDEALEWAERRVGELARGRVLDAGCGPGRFLRESWIGVDVDPVALRYARLRSSHVCFADARALPFPAEMFDTALALRMLNATGDVDAALAELHRVLRSGGTLLVLTRDTSAPATLGRFHRELTRRPEARRDRLDAQNGELRLLRFFTHVAREETVRRFTFTDHASALDHYARMYLHRGRRDGSEMAMLFGRARERILETRLPIDDEDRLTLFAARR